MPEADSNGDKNFHTDVPASGHAFFVKGGGSYESQCDMRPFWGMPAGAKVTGLTIHWPSGSAQEYPLTEANRSLTIIEPNHEPVDPFDVTKAG